ncbi:ABC transporter permease [Bacillus timonensis]|nr:ABC transporter permease [Bacillus timonensis]
MNSLRVGNLVVRIWKNNWLEATKQSPIIGMLPLVFIGILMFSVYYAYSKIEETLLQIGGDMGSTELLFYFQNFLQVIFIAITVISFIVWQMITRTNVENKSIQSLPISRFQYKGGMLIPIFGLMFIVLIPVTVSMAVVFFRKLDFNGAEMIEVSILFTLLIFMSVLIGITSQQIIYVLSRYIGSKDSQEVQNVLQVIIPIVFILILATMYQLFPNQFMSVVSFINPTTKYIDNIKALLNHDPVWISIVQLGAQFILYLSVLIGLLWIENIWKEERSTGFVPLKRVPFTKYETLNITILEIKRLFRNIENLLYCAIGILLLFISGYYLNVTVRHETYAMLFSQFSFFIIMELLTVFALTSRGKDSGKEKVYYHLPLKKISYVLGKLFFYVTFLPIIGIIIYYAIMFMGKYDILFNGETLAVFLLLSIFLMSLAFLLGILVPADEKKLMNQIVNVLLYLVISIPAYLLFVKLLNFSIYWDALLVVVTISATIIISYIAELKE